MGTSKVAIICDGKEISYGMNYKNIYIFKKEKEKFLSDAGEQTSVEIYSPAAFKHANISKNAIKIYVNDLQKIDSSYDKIFDQYGMKVYFSDRTYIIKAEENELSGDNYEGFLRYANEKRNEYIKLEERYFNIVNETDPNWIAGQFVKDQPRGIFGKGNENKTKKQQQYDCLSFVLYLEFVNKKSMGVNS